MFDYADERGAVLYQTVKFADGLAPRFMQRHPDGQGGWKWGIEGIRRILYRLPDVVKAVAEEQVGYIAEGEKDAESLRARGLVATTNPMGAGKWRNEYSEILRGADVVIIPDNDKAGRDHAEQVATSLSGSAKRVRVLDLAAIWPECPAKGDTSDWIKAGGTGEKLKALVEALPDWKPAKIKPEEPSIRETPRPLMRAMPPAESFPVEALGERLGAAARAIHDRVQTPMAICAQSVLATATFAVQTHADVVLPIGGDRVKPVSAYFVTIAESGERKTEGDFQAGWPIRKREKALRERHDADAQSYTNDKLAWDKARDAAVKQSKGNRAATKLALDKLGPPPPPPLAAMLTSTEPTFEGLCKQFPTHHPSLGIFTSEGGQFIGGHGMNEENKLKTAAGLSALWDGEPVRRVRAGDGAAIFPGRRVTGHLMVQPEVASILFNDPLLLGQGLLSRLLVVAPESAAGTRLPRPEQADTDIELKRYWAAVLNILERPAPLKEGKINELVPRALPLSSEAREIWFRFVGHIEGEIGPGGALEPIKGFANKLPEHAARLAAVLTLIGDINAPDVSAGELDRGINLAEHYAGEALRIFESSRANADLMLAERLLRWLHSQWPEAMVSLPDIYQRSLNAISDQATARKLVNILTGHGWLEAVPGGASVAGRHRREAWRIVKEA
jgi:Protein of unknown function (DUF3987)